MRREHCVLQRRGAVQNGIAVVSVRRDNQERGRRVKIIALCPIQCVADSACKLLNAFRIAQHDKMPVLAVHAARRPLRGGNNLLKLVLLNRLRGKGTGGAAGQNCIHYFIHGLSLL